MDDICSYGDKDKAVNKENHSDKLIRKMRENNFDIEYIEVRGMGHGSIIPLEDNSRNLFKR